MPCFSEITSSFALWGRAALRLPSRDGDGAPAPPPPQPQDPLVPEGESLGINRATLGLSRLQILF